MATTRKLLRTLSALCLALVVYAATPHVHAEPESARIERFEAPLEAGSGNLISDDVHESHSSTASLDEHPCTLCRNKGEREVAAPTPLPFVLAASPARLVAAPFVAHRVEMLLVRRHPARGPPLA